MYNARLKLHHKTLNFIYILSWEDLQKSLLPKWIQPLNHITQKTCSKRIIGIKDFKYLFISLSNICVYGMNLFNSSGIGFEYPL